MPLLYDGTADGYVEELQSGRHTNFDGSLAVLIGRATSAMPTAHTHATVTARRTHQRTDGPRGGSRRRRWR